MFQSALTILLLAIASFSYGAEVDRFSLKGTITADPSDQESAGVAMLEDKNTNKTIIVRVGQRIQGSQFILESVNRKSVVLKLGNQKVTLYRNAWDGNRVTTARRGSYEYRGGYDRNGSSSDLEDRAYENDQSGYSDAEGAREFRAPPPPPPILPPTDNYNSEPSGLNRKGRIAYPEEEVPLGEQIPGVYPD